jgi:hypothetical protein
MMCAGVRRASVASRMQDRKPSVIDGMHAWSCCHLHERGKCDQNHLWVKKTCLKQGLTLIFDEEKQNCIREYVEHGNGSHTER